jgi:hypothetical protein
LKKREVGSYSVDGVYHIQGDSEISLEKMTFGGEIKRWKLLHILVFSTPMNREYLSEYVHFIH